MKSYSILFILFFHTLIQNGWAREYVEVELNNGKIISGELLELYSDKWFYEETDAPDEYLLLFSYGIYDEKKTNESPFQIYNTREIKKYTSYAFQTQLYDTYLKNNEIIFKSHPVMDATTITGNEGHHKYEKMFGNFAWDIGVMDQRGKFFEEEGLNNENYFIFGKEVYSPFRGIIVGAQKSWPDNPADPSLSSDLSGKTNNYLTIKIHSHIFLSLVHFQENTIPVKIGDEIEEGTYLGKVGNSGISYLPHLHYTLYTYIEKLDRFISIPALTEWQD
ncbi:MAG: hypothetical protein CME60_13495 [Halobacteriovoraceae bacterium]|nr:hypothetical protein [Halobacteriovoraceae bacterium]